MASSTSGGRSSSRENTAKNMVSDQISQAVLSTSNLLHLMQQSSPSQIVQIMEEECNGKMGREGKYYFLLAKLKEMGCQMDQIHQYAPMRVRPAWTQRSLGAAQLIKLPKNLLLKSSTIKNTGHLLEQMPRVISSLDAHMETGLQSLPHLQTVIQLLENMESCQLSSLSQAHVLQEEHEGENQPSNVE